MDTTLKKQDLKTILVEQFEQQKHQLKHFTAKREEAMQHFEVLGFPTTKHEEWKYVNLNNLNKVAFDFSPHVQLTAKEIQPYLLTEENANQIVFINGQWQVDLSILVTPSNQLIIKPLVQAFEENFELVSQYFGKIALTEKEAFVALNTALAENGLFVYVPDNQVIEQPIIMQFFTDATEQQPINLIRNLFVFGKNSQVTLLKKFDTLGQKHSLNNIVNEIFVHQQAVIDYYKIQNENEQAFHIGATKVYQERQSNFTSTVVDLNGAIVRNNLDLCLDGEYCQGNMFGLYMPQGRTLIDNHTSVNHTKPNAESNELYKGVLNDKATGIFNGKIFVQQDAQKTNAYQQNRNILLSNDASVNTKPQLEIWADDVKCSHGATVGSIDKDAMFYLRSRGVDEANAKSLLIYAFANDILEKIKIESLKVYLESLILERLKLEPLS